MLKRFQQKENQYLPKDQIRRNGLVRLVVARELAIAEVWYNL